MEPAKILELLEIIEATRQLPKLKTIHDKAMRELEKYAESLEPKPEPASVPRPTLLPQPEARPMPRRVAEVENQGEPANA